MFFNHVTSAHLNVKVFQHLSNNTYSICLIDNPSETNTTYIILGILNLFIRK